MLGSYGTGRVRSCCDRSIRASLVGRGDRHDRTQQTGFSVSWLLANAYWQNITSAKQHVWVQRMAVSEAHMMCATDAGRRIEKELVFAMQDCAQFNVDSSPF